MTTRGAFIVFEGLDRSGKTTQSTSIIELLPNAIHMRFPNRESDTGKVIDAYLKGTIETDNHAIHLLFSANRWEQNNRILELLNSGVTVIVDRYVYSGTAYTAAKGYDLDWCFNSDIGLPKPDLVIYMKINVDDIAKRGGFGDERYENKEFLQRVSDNYDKLIHDSWFIIDATLDINIIKQIIYEKITTTMANISPSVNKL